MRQKQTNKAPLKIIKRLKAGVFVGIMLSVTQAWAATPLSPNDGPQAWLAHMAQAVRELNYRGRSILMNGDQLNSVEVVHGVINGEPWERVVHLTGQPAEILRRGTQISCLHPDSQADFEAYKSSVVPIKPLTFAKEFKVPAHYSLSKGGVGRVAGRSVYRVDVLPKDQARYGYQFWLDQHSGLLLKSVTVDKKGRGLEVFEFVSIDIDVPLQEDAFKPGPGLKWVKKEQPEGGQSSASSPEWRVAWLPSGFQLASQEVRMVGGVNASTQVFSDGLAAFSVFLEAVDKRIQGEGSRTHGATTAFSRRLLNHSAGYLVTVVGEIPMETAMQIAMSVKLASSR